MKIILTKFHFWLFQKWPKINFWIGKMLKTAKNAISRKKILDLFDFTNFFAWTFLNFPARYVLCWIDFMEKNYFSLTKKKLFTGQNILVTISGKKNRVRVYYLSWLKSKILRTDNAIERRAGWINVGDLQVIIILLFFIYKIKYYFELLHR